MTRRVLGALLAALVLGIGFGPARARAQAVPPRGVPGYASPVVSPYLNLLRRGSDPAVNYYGLVRPEVEFRNSIQSLQQQVTTLGTETTAEQGAAALPPTGHPTRFRDYSRYFARTGAVGVTGAAPAAAPRPASPAPTPAPARPAAATAPVR
jgi:hypothetical protein